MNSPDCWEMQIPNIRDVSDLKNYAVIDRQQWICNEIHFIFKHKIIDRITLQISHLPSFANFTNYT